MNILHITPHLGAGVGTVIKAWTAAKKEHKVMSLEEPGTEAFFPLVIATIRENIKLADIVVVHYWDRESLEVFLSQPLPPCRLVFYCHKNYPISQKELDYPDLFIDTSPIQGHGRYIWATGNMERFQKIKQIPRDDITVGFIGHRRKASPELEHIMENTLPCSFLGIGEDWPAGKVVDIVPYLMCMDIFAYMLRPEHYGTCEQVLGEALSAGLPILVMDNPCEREIISNGQNGYIAESVEDYISKLNMLIEHKEVREWLGTRAKESAKRIYDIDNMVIQWEDVFTELMKQPKKKKGGLIL